MPEIMHSTKPYIFLTFLHFSKILTYHTLIMQEDLIVITPYRHTIYLKQVHSLHYKNTAQAGLKLLILLYYPLCLIDYWYVPPDHHL
jgi:hypothetical protein